jgi:carbon storage regulator
MLVLSRRVGETVVVNDDIQITIVEAKGGKIRLGITAPANVPIDRLEVHQRRQEFLVDEQPNFSNAVVRHL